MIDHKNISNEHVLECVTEDLISDKSIGEQVMAWHHQVTSHYQV